MAEQNNKPLRICHLFSSQETGGLEKHVQEQSRWQLANTDAEIYVIAHPRYQGLFSPQVRFLAVNTDRSRRNLFLNLNLLRLMRRHAFDLVHAHGGKPANLMRDLQRFIPARVVITRHNISNPKDGVARFFPQRIAVSKKAVANSTLEWQLIPNGTELPPRGESYAGYLQQDRGAVICVARMVPAKGIDILLRAWAGAELAGAQLYLLGDGPQKAEYQQLATQLQLNESVHFLGHQPQVADWYGVADLLVIASRHEGGPYTVAEALLAGCPVVSTDVGYVAENIPAQYLAASAEPQSLAVLLTSAMGDREKLRDNYAPYVARARARLTLDAMAGETWQVYRAALSDD